MIEPPIHEPHCNVVCKGSDHFVVGEHHRPMIHNHGPQQTDVCAACRATQPERHL